jgi:tetratricopeptide (TPR) repeat protein
MVTHIANDPFGLPVQVQQASSLAGVAGFIEGFLSYEPRILDVLAAAEQDESLIVQAYAAVLYMFSEAAMGPPAARRLLERARRAALPASERERRFAGAVQHWVDGDLRSAIAGLEALVADYPRDLAALKLGQYLAFNLGDSPTMLRLALHARAAANEVAWWHGMAAFAYEQCHRLDEAEAAARQALALRADEPWAQHAIAHVTLTQGRLSEGAELMQAWRGGWAGKTSFMRTHNWWHLALFELELGDEAAALRLYDDEVWGVDKTYTQDQIGAVSLLARLELAGVDVGQRWQELAGWIVPHVVDQVQPFLDLQYLYGLARADRPEADDLLARIERHAPQAPEAARVSWQRVAVPAAQGLLAHARGRWADAVDGLALALPRLVSIGGSHAQRSLFELIHLDALQRSGQLAGAYNLLQPLANAQQQSVTVRRRLGQVSQALGLPTQS